MNIRHMLLLLAAGLLALPASAQFKPTTKKVCHAKCLDLKFEENPQTIRFTQKMKQLDERKKTETDPARLKQLEREREDELDKRLDFVEKTCKEICANNPED